MKKSIYLVASLLFSVTLSGCDWLNKDNVTNSGAPQQQSQTISSPSPDSSATKSKETATSREKPAQDKKQAKRKKSSL